MKKAILLSAVILMACCSSTKERSGTVTAAKAGLDDHHLACRETADERVRHILDEIVAQGDLEGVVLYFHGGLSSQNYMETELGPVLMGSLFADEAMRHYYPVFMNYDASPFTLQSLKTQIRALTADAAFQRARDKFHDKIRNESKFLKSTKSGMTAEEAEMTVARQYIDAAIVSNNKSTGFLQKSADEKQAVYFDILKKDALAEQLEQEVVRQEPDFGEVRRDLQEVGRTGDKDADKALVVTSTAKMIIRALARFATGTHHQIVPTFEEEAFRAYAYGPLSIQKVAARHWKLVKKNAQECFSGGSSGRYLIDSLLSRDIPIHTVSHSAGSIPTGRLLEYLADKGRAAGSVNLIAPAINQAEFSDLFIKNKNAAGNIYGYVLSENQEEVDSIAFGAYPASLLYFVSGAADDAWYNDKMLMIDQHLRPKRKIYSNRIYKKFTGEDPGAVWAYLAEQRNNWFFYPSPELPYETDDGGKRASHECTKYPWIATEVTKSIIANVTGNKAAEIPVPAEDIVPRLNEKCEARI